MQSEKSVIDQLIEKYSLMSHEEIENEVNALSDQIYAILTATECLQMEIMFDREVEIHFSIRETHSTLN